MTGILAVKLRRDLRAVWARLLMMVIAIAVSLIVTGGVLLAWSAVGRETSGAYAGTEPASATILLDEGVDAARMAEIATAARQRPGVLQAAGRTQFSSEISVNGTARSIPVQVFVAAADDPMRVATFEVEGGTWPPAPGEILIRRDALALLDVRVGDTLTAEAPDERAEAGAPAAETPPADVGGEQLTLRVAGTVYDPSLAPSPQQQIGAAYLSAATLATGGQPVLMDQLKIQVAGSGEKQPTHDRAVAASVASDVGAWMQSTYGVTVREIQVPEPYAHPHQGQADALLLSLLAGGAAALVLSTILVATMLNVLFTQQIPQIGIMKAIGARSGRIGQMYLTMTLLIAAAATALALPPAVLLGRLAVTNLSAFLGIRPVSLNSPWWTYLVVVATGLALPPLMALVPLLRASRITVRAAIDHHGGAASAGATTGLLARLGRMRRLNRGLLMALRNTVRRPARFALSVGLLATAGMVFVAGMSLNSGTQAVEEERKAERTWDVEVQLTAPVPTDKAISVVTQLPGVSRAEGFQRRATGVAGAGTVPVTKTYPDQGHGSLAVITVPDANPMQPRPKLLDGRWLRSGETGAVVLNQVTVKNAVPDVGAGDTVQLVIGGKATTWDVVGVVQEREGGSGGTYTTARGLAAALGEPERVNGLRIATDRHDEQSRVAVADAVNAALTDAGIAVASANSVSRADAAAAGHLGPILLILLGIALPLGVIGLIGLASTMSANILDRTREFGVMHAIGALPRTVRRVVVAEAVFLALISVLVAVVPALILTAVLGAGLGNLFMYAPLPYRISFLAVGVWVALVVLGAVLASDAAATRASRLTVREALSYL